MSSTKLNRVRIIIVSIMNALYLRKSNDKLPESVVQCDQPKKLNFEYCLRPIYFISRVSGLLPFSVARDSNGIIHAPRINAFDFVFFIVSISWYLFLTFVSFREIQFWPNLNKSQVLTVSNYSLLIVTLIFGALTITMDLFNRAKLIDILKKFITFDQNVSFVLSGIHRMLIFLMIFDFIWNTNHTQIESFGVQFDYKQVLKKIETRVKNKFFRFFLINVKISNRIADAFSSTMQ